MSIKLPFHPITKDQQLYRNRKPKKRKVKGREVPSKKVRGQVSKTEYMRVVEDHGQHCFFCGTQSNLECHHVMPKGYSRVKNGRGVFYNLRFLCSDCHRGKGGVHQNRVKMEQLQEHHENLYGPHYWQDRFDLFQAGLIPNTTKESYEGFMQQERQRMKRIALGESQ